MNDYLGRLALRGRGELEVARPVVSPAFLPETTTADQEEESLERRPRRQIGGPTQDPPSTSRRPKADKLAARTPQVTPAPLKKGDEGNSENSPEEKASSPHDSNAAAPANKSLISVLLQETGEREGPSGEGEISRRIEQEGALEDPALGRQNDVQVERIGGGREKRPSRHQPEGSAGAEQTIHISIGRVEVRAVMPPSPRPPAPPAAPQSLSLEEYLKARREKRKE